MPAFNVYLFDRWINEIFCTDPDIDREDVRQDQIKNGIPAEALTVTRAELS